MSRNINYYKSFSCEKCSSLHEKIKSIYNDTMTSEKKFIILENMLNLSAKVFYSESKKKVFNEPNKYEQAKYVFEEDTYNLICAIQDLPISFSAITLPASKTMVENRQIELDNKALLYVFCRNLNISADHCIILSGLGGIFLGPFMKIMHNCQYSVCPLSTYAGNKELMNEENFNYFKYCTEQGIIQHNKFIFLDDNIGTGNTAKKIKESLALNNAEYHYGAVQYNWINYFKVCNGEKSINKFDPYDVDILTPFNYPGHKLLEHSISHLKNSGDEYVEYIKSKRYRRDDCCDLNVLAIRGIKYAKESNVDFSNISNDSKNLFYSLREDIAKIENKQFNMNTKIHDKRKKSMR